MQSQRSSDEKDRILNDKINKLQNQNEDKDRKFVEAQNMQRTLAEAQNAYNNLYHAVSTGQPLLEEEDEEEDEIQEEIPSTSIPHTSKDIPTPAPPSATPSFFEINTPSTLPKVDLPDFQPLSGDAKLETVIPDQRIKEADPIAFEPNGTIKAVRYWKTKAERKVSGSSTRPRAAFVWMTNCELATLAIIRR